MRDSWDEYIGRLEATAERYTGSSVNAVIIENAVFHFKLEQQE